MSQYRSPNYMNMPHLMPSPPAIPWNAEAMPWTISGPYNRVMEFNATAQLPHEFINKSLNYNTHKRKSDIPLPSPSKQFITEEKMIAHLNGLHISPSYISHNVPTDKSGATIGNSFDQQNSLPDVSMDSEFEPYTIQISAKDLEEKLKNANRITVCDEIKKFHENDTILPKALLSHIEKPCKALVLWQPPQKLTDMIVNKNSEGNNIDIEEGDEDQQNNNSSTLDFNYGMETDMM